MNDLITIIRPLAKNPQWGMGKQQQDLALGYIAAVLEKEGFKIEFHDLPKNLNLDFKESRLFIIPTSDLTFLNDGSPIIREALEVISLIKNFDGLKVFVGPYSREALKFTENVIAVDKEVDPEYVILEIAKGVKPTNVKGVWLDYNTFTGQRERIKNLDELPFPSRHYFNKDYYNRNTGYMLISRGCPFQCGFCYHWGGNEIRFRSLENIIEEIEILLKNGITYIDFKDDTFTLNKELVYSLCDEIIDKKLNFSWFCSTRVDKVDKDLLMKMKEAGCKWIGYGVESGNQEILNGIKKGINIDQIRNAFKITKESGMKASAYFILGLPWETKETVKETVELAMELNPDSLQFALATPLPGTWFYEYATENNLIEGSIKDFNILKLSPVKSEKMSTQELESLSKSAKRKFIFYKVRKELRELITTRKDILSKTRKILRVLRDLSSDRLVVVSGE